MNQFFKKLLIGIPGTALTLLTKDVWISYIVFLINSHHEKIEMLSGDRNKRTGSDTAADSTKFSDHLYISLYTCNWYLDS